MRLSGKSKTASGVGAAAVIAMSAAFIAPWEGLKLKTYKDLVGVNTVCYGHTGKYAVWGATYTAEKCWEIFLDDVGTHYDGITKCIPVAVVPRSVQASALELAFNVGVGGFCGSTMARLLRDGRYVQACAELDKWVKAGGKTVRGLVNRRNASEEMCKVDL